MSRGRPPGLLANPDAFADGLDSRPQRWLADKADMSVSHLNEIISGKKGVQEDQARKIAEIIGMRPGTLFPQLAIFRVEARVFVVSAAGEAA